MEINLLKKLSNLKIPKSRFFIFNLRNINLKKVLIVLLFIVLAGGSFGLYREVTAIPPQVMVKEAITKTMEAQTYRYQAVSKVIVNGEEQVLSSYLGEKGLNGTHLKGKVNLVNAEVDIYQISDKLFRKDSASNNWLVLDGIKKTQFQNLLAEIDPMMNFVIGEIFEVQEAGKEKIDDVKCIKYEVQAKTENKYMTMFWHDFNYFIWVDKKDHLIKQAIISAEQKDDPTKKLELSIQFSELNEEINVTPPEI